MLHTEIKRTEFTIINSKKKSPEGVDESKCYRSKKQGDATEKIKKVCLEDPSAHITVYGGDGSVYESVNAIMNANAGDSALLTIHPFGTGNDFVRSLPTEDKFEKKIDLIKFGDRYSANILNVGFDCDVVAITEKLKKLKLVKGSVAYAFGVLFTIFGKIGKDLEIEFTLEDGTVETEKGKFLLCAVANGKYYGGGFKCAPNAELDDGILDVILVKKISRIRFATFVGGYKKGTHITPDGKIADKYASVAKYKRCTGVKFKGLDRLCADGELITCSEADITVAHKAITIVK